MGSVRTSALIEDLRARIGSIEKRPALFARPNSKSGAALATGGAPAGLLHEVWADRHDRGGALLGFALMQARGLLSMRRPAILLLQLAFDGQETGLPFGAGLARFGIMPDQLLIGRLKTIADLLWAAEEAISCPAVAAVIAETAFHHTILDFTATRRLSLRAEAAETSLFLMRYGREREASAARLRWQVSSLPSAEMPFDRRAPGAMRWQVRLEKGLRAGAGEQGAWILQETDNGFAIADDGAAGRRAFAAAAADGSQFPALGDRLSQTA